MAPPPTQAPPRVAQPTEKPPNGDVAPRGLTRAGRSAFEGWIIALIAAVAYTIVGELVIANGHVIVFDAVDRLSRAYMVWWNEPPKLAAVGLSLTPNPTLFALPFALVKPLATSLAALPVISAIPAAGTLAILNATFARCEMSRALRYPALLLLGANPLFVYYAGNGADVALGVFLVAATLLALVSWQIEHSTRHLVGAGLAMSFAALTFYPLIIWGAALALAIVALREYDNVPTAKLESAALVYLTPFAYAVMIWVLLNALILGSAFGWLGDTGSYAAINASGGMSQAGIALSAAFGDLLELIVGAAPIALISVPALLLAAFSGRKNAFCAWLALLIVVLALLIVANARVYDRADLLSLDTGLYLAIGGTIGAAWVYRAVEDWRAITAFGLLALLALGLPLSWNAMENYPHQNQEQAFTRFISSGDSQEGTASRGGYEVGIDPELEMAEAIKRIAGGRKNLILTDNAQTYAVILLTGRPDVFVDRVDEGNDEWMVARDNLPPGIEYVLVAIKAPGDQIVQRYPGIAYESDNHFLPVVANERYMLARIAMRNGRQSDAVGGGTNLVTPLTPPSPSDEPSMAPGVSSPSAGGKGEAGGTAKSPSGPTSAPTIEGQ